jgi:hypothetical protein
MTHPHRVTVEINGRRNPLKLFTYRRREVDAVDIGGRRPGVWCVDGHHFDSKRVLVEDHFGRPMEFPKQPMSAELEKARDEMVAAAEIAKPALEALKEDRDSFHQEPNSVRVRYEGATHSEFLVGGSTARNDQRIAELVRAAKKVEALTGGVGESGWRETALTQLTIGGPLGLKWPGP